MPPASPAKQRSLMAPFVLVLVGLCAISFLYNRYGRDEQPGQSTATATAQTSADVVEYVKEVVAYKEGEKAFVIYFILADEHREMVASDGTATLTIMEDDNPIYSETRQISAGDFYRTDRGRGSFKEEVLLYSFDRIAYSQFNRQPTELLGEVRLKFRTPSGQMLEGNDTITFDR